MIEIERTGAVWIIRMDNGENRFNRDSVDRLHGHLDEIERQPGPLAVVTTGQGKFYSNGLDLDWMAQAGPWSETSSAFSAGCCGSPP